MKILFALISFFLINSGEAIAKDNCVGCDKLKLIETQYRSKKDAKPEYYYGLLRKANEAIASMSTKEKKLTNAQINRIVEVMRLSVARDPGEGIIRGNIEILKANQKSFTDAFSKLPKKEGEELKKSMILAIDEETEGQDTDTPKY